MHRVGGKSLDSEVSVWELLLLDSVSQKSDLVSWRQEKRAFHFHVDSEVLKYFYFFWWVCVIGNRTAIYEQVCTGVWKPSPAQSAVLGMSAWTEKQL